MILSLLSLSRGRSDRNRRVVFDVDVDLLCAWIVDALLKEGGCIQACEETRQLPRKIKATIALVLLLVLVLAVGVVLIMLMLMLMLIIDIVVFL
jgi:hypothetical protein